MLKSKKNKTINLRTRDLKIKILGDWVENTGIIFTTILILTLQSEKGDLVYSFFSIFDNFNNFFQMILALIFFLVPPIFTLVSVFEISKKNRFSKFNWSFWIIMALCVAYGMTGTIDYYTYVFFIIAYLINFNKIKNIIKSLSYTFGQIPLVLISFLFIGTLINLFKRSFK